MTRSRSLPSPIALRFPGAVYRWQPNAAMTLTDGAPDQRHLLDGIEISAPEETYDGATATIDLGGREAILHAVGTAHSPGDQIVHLPDAGVLFAGDLVEERIYPIVPFFPPLIEAGDIDVPRWKAALNGIATREPRIVVPGHGNLGGLEIAGDADACLGALEEIATTGASAEEKEAEVRRRYPTWEQAAYVAPALQYFGR